MRVFALFFVIACCPAQAGYSEYWLLDLTDCKSYVISTDIDVFEDPDPVKYQKTLDDRDETIKKLKADRDGSWRSGWGVAAEGGTYFGLCKLEYKTKVSKFGGVEFRHFRSFQCVGDSRYPLPELNCKFRHRSRWHEKCAVKGKLKHDIRLYWVDTTEREDGSSIDVNEGYERDLAGMKARCKSNK